MGSLCDFWTLRARKKKEKEKHKKKKKKTTTPQMGGLKNQSIFYGITKGRAGQKLFIEFYKKRL